MSLKDRLNTSNTTTTIKPISKPQEEKQPQYYSSNEIANKIDSLGAIDTILNDDDLNSIFISGAKNVYIQRRGKIQFCLRYYRRTGPEKAGKAGNAPHFRRRHRAPLHLPGY